MLTLQSGVPLAIAQTTNNNAFAGFGTQRPNLIGDPTLPADERSVGSMVQHRRVQAAPQFTIGTSSRNPVRGPGYRNLDLALMRRVPLTADKSLEMRAEIFNATNTPPLGAPNITVAPRRSERLPRLATHGWFNSRSSSCSNPADHLSLEPDA